MLLPKPRLILISALFLFSTSFGSAAYAASPQKHLPPQLMLWSWFEGGDFNFLPDNDIGVAYLALSLHFEGQDQVAPWPRAVPIRIPSTTYQMAVVRFDFPYWNKNQIPAFSIKQRGLAVRMIAEIAQVSGAKAIQLDFDAPRSAWQFYRQLLFEVRQSLGPDVFLSITALASWCEGTKSWLDGLPVDEIVPMAFSMGPTAPAITTMLQRGGEFAFAGCRNSIGVELPQSSPVQRFGTVPSPSNRDSATVGQYFDPNAFVIPPTTQPGSEASVAPVKPSVKPYIAIYPNPAFLTNAQPPEPIRPHKSQRAYFFPRMQNWSPETLKKARELIQP